MGAGEIVATIVIIIAAVVIMRRRGAGWGRTAVVAVGAWLASGVVIVLWELVFAATGPRGDTAQQPAAVPNAVQQATVALKAGKPSGSSSVANPPVPPTPRPLPPTRTPVAPEIKFPVGTVVLVNDGRGDLRSQPSIDSRIREQVLPGDRLVIIGNYVVDEGARPAPEIWWPVKKLDSGPRGYIQDRYIDKDVIAGTSASS